MLCRRNPPFYFLHRDGTLGEFQPIGYAAGQAFELPPGAIVVGCRLRLVRRPAKQIHKDVQQRLKLEEGVPAESSAPTPPSAV